MLRARIRFASIWLVLLWLVSPGWSIGSGLHGGVTLIGEAGTPVTESGRVFFRYPVIPDPNDLGVVHVSADDVDLDFGDVLLRGAFHDQLPDRYTGVGILVTGRNVTLRNVRLSGFRIGILAIGADGLRIERAELSDLGRPALGSLLHFEDDEDRIDPSQDVHWSKETRAAVALLGGANMHLREVRVRDGKHGIMLHEARDVTLVDNDCSFLSGWGIAMRGGGNLLLSRNRTDFCVRGFSPGFYAHGYGAAGLLLLDAGANVRIVEHSATHCSYGLLDVRFGDASVAPLHVARSDFRFAVRASVRFGVRASELPKVIGPAPDTDGRFDAFDGATIGTHRLESNRGDSAEFIAAQHPAGDDAPEALGTGIALAGREAPEGLDAVRMLRFGPWNRTDISLAEESGLVNFEFYRVLGVDPDFPGAVTEFVERLEGTFVLGRGGATDQIRVIIPRAQTTSITSFRLGVVDGATDRQVSGHLLTQNWAGTLFDSEHDPVTAFDDWQGDAFRRGIAIAPRRIDFPIFRDPLTDHQARFGAILRDIPMRSERFGMTMQTRVTFPAGSWRLTLIGDDGFRLRINDELVIDEWANRPRLHRASHVLTIDREREVALGIDYFQASGPALLRLLVDRVDER